MPEANLLRLVVQRTELASHSQKNSQKAVMSCVEMDLILSKTKVTKVYNPLSAESEIRNTKTFPEL